MWVGAMSTGNDFGHRWGRNGEFCVAVALSPGLLAYWLIAYIAYSGLIRFNGVPRRLKGQVAQLSSIAWDLTDYA